ncbi:hypothetical protein [uncultured Bacteroides sp.]|nr:hypothetical protein [uncultured Bacteroides sp.]
MILILVGAIILVACSFTGNVNNNLILGGAAVVIVIGLVAYIAINKRIAD